MTIEGAKYPLCDAEARRGDSLTISNEWIEPTVRLRIREGLCWLICSEQLHGNNGCFVHPDRFTVLKGDEAISYGSTRISCISGKSVSL